MKPNRATNRATNQLALHDEALLHLYSLISGRRRRRHRRRLSHQLERINVAML